MQFEHARLLAVTAERIDDDVEKNAETVLLRYETDINTLADALGAEISFGNDLEEHLQERDQQIPRLKRTVDSLDARLAGLNAREEQVTAELQNERERDRTLNRIRAVFNENEAEVRTSGDQVIVRMLGLNFPSGSSEIQPKNFGLLTKMQRVL